MKLTETETKLCAHIAGRRDELLDDLKRHVALPTGKNNLSAIDETREIFRGRLEAIGATSSLEPGEEKPAWLGGPTGDQIPPMLVCDRLSAHDGTRVLIAGHMDTVHDPEGDFRELSIARGGKTAIGPGCVDMKGGLVIAAAALESLEAVGLPARWTFTFNADEETGTYHSEKALRAQAARHDVGLALEPALPDGSLAVDRMGSGQFLVETRGKSTHVGRAFADGVSAVTALAERLVAISKMPDLEQGRIINVGPIEGGVATNAVPDRARAWGNVRFPNQEGADAMGELLDALGTDADAMPGCTVYRSFNRPAKPLIPATEKLALAARAVAESLGQSLPFAKTGGVCDGNILQDAGLPAIDTLGVRGGGLHTPDEWIELDSLVERCQLLAVLVHRLTIGFED